MVTTSFEEDEAGAFREIGDIPPAHYLLKLESFSLLSKNGVNKIKSKNFQAGEHQWQMVLFPRGNNGGKDEYVSIYLMLESTSSLPAGKGVNAFFKFFLFDQLRGKYLTVQGRVRRFDRVKYEWGFAKFICLQDLKEPTNGYLVNDTCLFGVEVIVTEPTSIGECLSVSEVAKTSGKYKWVVNQYSELGKERFSDEFAVGGYKWKLRLYPKGNLKHEGFSLSLFLERVDCGSATNGHEVKGEFTLELNDQFNKDHVERKATVWFGASNKNWGWANFIELKEVTEGKKGYIVEDRCIIEAELTVLCETSQRILNC
ncbi:uncharacterized protein LOC141704835 [Apium graveolens]|uniref:uncharacterized protein LOC141704835 n=1 Tax=Apium graveolens TaxID=4045 RepID=UPI003D7B3DCD